MSIKLGVPSKGRLMEKPLTGSVRMASACPAPGPSVSIRGR